MGSLSDIEAAIDTLAQEQKEELFLFLATRLRGGTNELPSPHEFSREQLAQWIADDEAGYLRFRTAQ